PIDRQGREPARDAGSRSRHRRRRVRGRIQHSVTAMDIESVCIFGGCGFVGRSVAEAAATRGLRVRVVTRSPMRARALLVLPTLEAVVADPNDAASLPRALDNMDAAVNLVG